jgi:hypothetical protein
MQFWQPMQNRFLLLELRQWLEEEGEERKLESGPPCFGSAEVSCESMRKDGVETVRSVESPVVAAPQGGMHEINIERAAKANDAEVPVFLWDIQLLGILGRHDEFSEKELVGINYSCMCLHQQWR